MSGIKRQLRHKGPCCTWTQHGSRRAHENINIIIARKRTVTQIRDSHIIYTCITPVFLQMYYTPVLHLYFYRCIIHLYYNCISTDVLYTCITPVFLQMNYTPVLHLFLQMYYTPVFLHMYYTHILHLYFYTCNTCVGYISIACVHVYYRIYVCITGVQFTSKT